MANRNETPSYLYKYLDKEQFQPLYEAFIEAFSDYVIPFALTETQFRNHINLNAVDLERTIACFNDERLIAFSLNGFGEWNGKQTVYDAGTGVVPAFRRQGVSKAMFELMIPRFKDDGIEQWLLEVVTSNEAAIALYEKLNFKPVREIALLQCDNKIAVSADVTRDCEIREMPDPDWSLLTTFWDGTTTWQNSVAAVERSRHHKRILGAYSNEKCVGYIVFSSNSGRVAQLAVDKNCRNRGVGTALLLAVQTQTAGGYSLQIINVDKSLDGTITFFARRGFYEAISQFEMVMAVQ